MSPDIIIKRCRELPQPWQDPVMSGEGMSSMLKQDLVFCFSAMREDKSLGHIVCRSDGEDWEILTLWVQPEARRQRVAVGLIRHAISVAMLDKAKKIFLDVRPSNTPAVKLYQAHQFSQIATRAGYYTSPREDGAVYALEL